MKAVLPGSYCRKFRQGCSDIVNSKVQSGSKLFFPCFRTGRNWWIIHYLPFGHIYLTIADITLPKHKIIIAIAALEVLLAAETIVGRLGSGPFINLTGFFYPMVLNT